MCQFFLQGAIKKLQAAVEIEDAFAYMEPPRVYQPIRQCLGYVLLEFDQVEEAEKVVSPDVLTAIQAKPVLPVSHHLRGSEENLPKRQALPKRSGALDGASRIS